MKGNAYLPAQVIRLAETSSKLQSIARLKRAGILTKSGRLAKRYRSFGDSQP